MSSNGQRIPHPVSTRFDEELSTPVKRLKRHDSTDSSLARPSPPPEISPAQHPHKVVSRGEREIPDSEDEDERDSDSEKQLHGSGTELEGVLPPVRTDREAIRDYETARAAEDAAARLDKRQWIRGRNSIYVDAFNLALDTVLDEESHLFDAAEQEVFSQWRSLSYPAQYLYVRLFLRKTAAWHRIARLGYHSDVADLDAAVTELRRLRQLPTTSEPAPRHPGELVLPEGAVLAGDSFTFADSSGEHINTMEEASSLLSLDELKSLAKDVKAHGKNKKELLNALRLASQTQGGLGWKSLKRSDTEESAHSDSSHAGVETEAFGTNRDAHFVHKILTSTTGDCIRLSQSPFKLFERVHLVFYRSTEWTEKSLTTIILARISQRNYPDYIVARSADIFENRTMLLEFEAAIRTQFRIDSILEFNGKVTEDGFQEVQALAEAVYPRWQTLLTHELLKEESVYDSGEGAYQRRFSPAWVYTRIIHKGLIPLARKQMHDREHEWLTDLLDQRLFHPSRRGAWHQRKALLEEHYMWKLKPSEGRSEDAQRRHWRTIALRTCEQGLQDPDCHLIYHYDLQKRLVKLEKALRIPKRQQHDFGHALLAKPLERTVYGVRLQKPLPPEKRGDNTPPSLARRTSSPGRSAPGQRTQWLDVDDSGGAVTVEELALTHYRHSEGWKGLHTEGGVLRTLFGLLFHDLLFAYVPGVFQTAFQTAPLDLRTDAFFAARRPQLEHRFAALSNGAAPDLLAQAWDALGPRQTCIVGVRWDYARTDLLEIATAFHGPALAAVCRVLAQEYAQRGGGIPDLFFWRTTGGETPPVNGNAESSKEAPSAGGGEVMFVEVKSENDRLSDTQRLWIHVLAGAGVRVEVCHVLASEVRTIE